LRASISAACLRMIRTTPNPNGAPIRQSQDEAVVTWCNPFWWCAAGGLRRFNGSSPRCILFPPRTQTRHCILLYRKTLDNAAFQTPTGPITQPCITRLVNRSTPVPSGRFRSAGHVDLSGLCLGSSGSIAQRGVNPRQAVGRGTAVERGKLGARRRRTSAARQNDRRDTVLHSQFMPPATEIAQSRVCLCTCCSINLCPMGVQPDHILTSPAKKSAPVRCGCLRGTGFAAVSMRGARGQRWRVQQGALYKLYAGQANACCSLCFRIT